MAKNGSRGGSGRTALIILGLGVVATGLVMWLSGALDSTFSSANHGTVAIGEIVSAVQGDVYGKNDVQVVFTITFYTQDAQQVTATCKEQIANKEFANIHPGMLISIKYDPAKP